MQNLVEMHKIASLADLLQNKHKAKQPYYWQLHRLDSIILMLQRKTIQELSYVKLHLTALKLTEINKEGQ